MALGAEYLFSSRLIDTASHTATPKFRERNVILSEGGHPSPEVPPTLPGQRTSLSPPRPHPALASSEGVCLSALTPSCVLRAARRAPDLKRARRVALAGTVAAAGKPQEFLRDLVNVLFQREAQLMKALGGFEAMNQE